MEKVSFRMVAAIKVMDAMTKKMVTDARIVSCHGFRRINKENGIIVLVDDSLSPDEGEKEIFVDSPYYQAVVVNLSEKDQGELRKIWLVPGPRKGLPEQAAVIEGTTEPNATVSCEFRENESGMRITDAITDNTISLSTIGCREPEGSQFIISDGKASYSIYILDKLGENEEDGSFRYKYASREPVPDMDKKKTKLYPIVMVMAGEDGKYYLPVLQDFTDEGWQASLVFSKGDKTNEKKITVKPRTRLTEDCLKL